MFGKVGAAGKKEKETKERKNIQETIKRCEQVRESSQIRNVQKNWKTMGTETMKVSGWDLKKD